VINQGRYLKENFIPFQFFSDEKQYLTAFSKNSVFQEMSQNPFTLRLLITILPSLDNGLNLTLTKFDIY
jgi:hypothetical protein